MRVNSSLNIMQTSGRKEGRRGGRWVARIKGVKVTDINKRSNVGIGDIQGRSRNRCFRGKAVSITYSECVSVALVAPNAMRMRHIVICDLPSCTLFFHVIS